MREYHRNENTGTRNLSDSENRSLYFRVVIFADGIPFSVQLEGVKSEKRGMNHPRANQNAQFLLNIIYRLDKKI